MGDKKLNSEAGRGGSLTWGWSGEPAHGDLAGPGDTLHFILRTLGSRESDFNQGDHKVGFGFRTFWIGRGLSCRPARARDCAGARVMTVWVGQDQRGPPGAGVPWSTGGLRGSQLKSLLVRRAPGEEATVPVLASSSAPAPTHHGWSPGTACGPRPPHCSPHTQTALSPGGWGLRGAGHWRAGAWDRQTDRC